MAGRMYSGSLRGVANPGFQVNFESPHFTPRFDAHYFEFLQPNDK